MLTGDLLRFSRRKGRVVPRLIDPADAGLLAQTAELIRLIQDHVGRSRGELEARLDLAAPAGPEHAVERGLCKLLLDGCDFEVAAKVDPIALRASLFDRSVSAWRTRPAVELAHWRPEVLAQGAAAAGLTPAEAEASLYADQEANHVLVSWDPP